MDEAQYTAAAFHQAVLATNPQTAVFDCDGTLWEPDSGFGFLRWTLDQAPDLLTPARRAWIRERYRLYEAGVVDESTICGEMVEVYAGIAETRLRDAARSFVAAHVQPFLFPELLPLVAALRQRGTELWAVSSTNRWVIEAGICGEPFAIPSHRILAAEVAIEDGFATDRLLAVPTDDAKREALLAAGLAHPDVVFGNSIHDAAMLAIARRAFPVNPSPGLRAIAAEQGWRVFEPLRTGWRPDTTHAQTL
ncbi:MAG TPA: haloacid dehalogenase-like hydrolase [Acidobacteriaceae bacterium]